MHYLFNSIISILKKKILLLYFITQVYFIYFEFNIGNYIEKRAAFFVNGSEERRNNWAVIVNTSRFWYNYRHTANALSFYHAIKKLGFPDDQIILMLAEDIACSSRNIFPGCVYNDRSRHTNLYGDNVEVDYRGDEVTVSSFLRLITGRHFPHTPRSKRLLSNSESNIFIFLTGHGGNEFLKFQDWDEILSQDLADAFQQMHKQGRYKRLFFVVETCQAGTLLNKIYSPNILGLACSGLDENSYSHHSDSDLGVAVVDRFTYYSLKYLENIRPWSKNTIYDFFSYFTFDMLQSTAYIRTDLFDKRIDETYLSEFLATTGRTIFYSEKFPITNYFKHKNQISVQNRFASLKSFDFYFNNNVMTDSSSSSLLSYINDFIDTVSNFLPSKFSILDSKNVDGENAYCLFWLLFVLIIIPAFFV